MESEEALKYYLDEVKDAQNDISNIEEEVHLPNEAEQATDFLHRAGLSDLNKLYQEGREISDELINESVRQRNLTSKQAETVRHRVRTLNRTLRSRQNRRKHRQDVRDVAWKLETSSTGTRSRSATPDSLDSTENFNGTYQDDGPLSLQPQIDSSYIGSKLKIKLPNSDTTQNKKFHKNDKADVAHLESDNVILKAYQPLSENGTLPRPQRGRSGSDPTADVHVQPLKDQNPAQNFPGEPPNLHTQLSRSHTSIPTNNCSKIFIQRENEIMSFESFVKQNDDNESRAVIIQNYDIDEVISIGSLSDSEYQYLKPLLYVELVAIFDQYKIGKNFVKRKTNKNKGGNVFGVNLSTLVMRDMQKPTDNSMVPEIFQSILNQLNARGVREDGILRIACQKQKLDFLCEEIESKFFSNRREVEDLIRLATPHELSGVLKKLLRELPEPMFTTELFEMFYKTSAIPNKEDKIRALNLLVLMLPVEHRNTFKLLVEFLLNIMKHEEQNRMNLHNVAMITAPSFLPPRLLLPKSSKNVTKEDLFKQINGAAVCCCIMESILTAGFKLWSVPTSLAIQAQEAQKRAQVRKNLNVKEKDRRSWSGKTKLTRSSTQYEPGGMNIPKLKRNFFV